MKALVLVPSTTAKLFRNPGTESKLELKFVLAPSLGGQGYLQLLRAEDSRVRATSQKLEAHFLLTTEDGFHWEDGPRE